MRLCQRIDSMYEMRYLSPDKEVPPKDAWLDEDKLKEWVQAMEKARKVAAERDRQSAW